MDDDRADSRFRQHAASCSRTARSSARRPTSRRGSTARGAGARRGVGDIRDGPATRDRAARGTAPAPARAHRASRSTEDEAYEVLDGAARRARVELCFERCSGSELVPAADGVDGASRPHRDRRARRDGRRLVAAAQGLPGLRLRVGVHRHGAQPLARVVLDGLVRQPREGARLPRAAPLGRALAHGDVRVGGRAAELVVLPLRDVRPDEVRDVLPQVRHPRHDLGHERLVEALVAGEARLAGERGAAVELGVDARDAGDRARDAERLRLRRLQPDERVVDVALRDDRAAVEERR